MNYTTQLENISASNQVGKPSVMWYNCEFTEFQKTKDHCGLIFTVVGAGTSPAFYLAPYSLFSRQQPESSW